MLKRFFDKVFKLPPVGVREDIQKYLLAKFTNVKNPSSDKDDIYIYYLAARSSWWIGCVLAAFVAVVYCNEGFQTLLGWQFKIDYKHTRMVVFLEKYNDLYATIVIYALLPFYLVKYRWNINPKKFDVLSFDERFGENKKYPKKRWCAIPFALLLGLGSWILVYGGYLAPGGFILKWYNRDVIFSLLFYMVFVLLVTTAGCVFFLKSVVILWRFIGPYEEI